MCTSVCMCVHRRSFQGGLGACSPRKIFNFRRSEIDSGALLGKKM